LFFTKWMSWMHDPFTVFSSPQISLIYPGNKCLLGFHLHEIMSSLCYFTPLHMNCGFPSWNFRALGTIPESDMYYVLPLDGSNSNLIIQSKCQLTTGTANNDSLWVRVLWIAGYNIGSNDLVTNYITHSSTDFFV
jgi:hypothetical protein